MKIASYLATLLLSLLAACGDGAVDDGFPQSPPDNVATITNYGNDAFTASSFRAIADDAAALRYVGRATFVGRGDASSNAALILDSYEISSPTGAPVPVVRLSQSMGYHFAVAAVYSTGGDTWRIDIETNAPAGAAEVYVFAKGAPGASLSVRSAISLPAFAMAVGNTAASMVGGAVWHSQGFASASVADGIVAYTPGRFMVADSSNSNFRLYDLHVSANWASISLVTGAVQYQHGYSGATYSTLTPYAMNGGGVLVVDLSPYVEPV